MMARPRARVAVIGDHRARLPAHRAPAGVRPVSPRGAAAAWIPTEALALDAPTRLARVDGLRPAPGAPCRSLGRKCGRQYGGPALGLTGNLARGGLDGAPGAGRCG